MELTDDISRCINQDSDRRFVSRVENILVTRIITLVVDARQGSGELGITVAESQGTQAGRAKNLQVECAPGPQARANDVTPCQSPGCMPGPLLGSG